MSARTGILSIAALAVLATAAPAMASNPASGTVSDTSPSVTWQGQAPGYGVVPANILVTATGRDPLCPPKTCDTFQLTVDAAHPLIVTALCQTGNNFTELHVHTPDGTTLYTVSDQGSSAEIDLDQAAPGQYTIDVLTNDPAGLSQGNYDASADLQLPPTP